MLLERYVIWLILALVTGVISCLIAKKKGRDAALWFIAGVAFNIFGIIAIATVKNLKERRT